MPSTTQQILNQRQTTHGDFQNCAEISQTLKRIVRVEHRDLSEPQLEALEMIMLKVARILNGGQNHQDSWQDIAGYALLGGGLFEYTSQNKEK